MKAARNLGTIALVICMLACGPIVMIPGGKLSGSPQNVPSNWEFTESTEIFQLETNPDDPYSVNIWGIWSGDQFYVAGSKESQWTKNAAADSRVRLRVEDNLYELNAVTVTGDAEIETFSAGLAAKYDWEPEPDQRATSIVFRLDPR